MYLGLCLTPPLPQVLASGSFNPQYALELEGIDVSLANLLSFPFVVDGVCGNTPPPPSSLLCCPPPPSFFFYSSCARGTG